MSTTYCFKIFLLSRSDFYLYILFFNFYIKYFMNIEEIIQEKKYLKKWLLSRPFIQYR